MYPTNNVTIRFITHIIIVPCIYKLLLSVLQVITLRNIIYTVSYYNLMHNIVLIVIRIRIITITHINYIMYNE